MSVYCLLICFTLFILYTKRYTRRKKNDNHNYIFLPQNWIKCYLMIDRSMSMTLSVDICWNGKTRRPPTDKKLVDYCVLLKVMKFIVFFVWLNDEQQEVYLILSLKQFYTLHVAYSRFSFRHFRWQRQDR